MEQEKNGQKNKNFIAKVNEIFENLSDVEENSKFQKIAGSDKELLTTCAVCNEVSTS